MDAGIMDGSNLFFGAVGAMPGIKNPIAVARMLAQEQSKGLLPLGRVPPIFMVGDGARDWAVRHGIKAVPQETLISEKANKLFKHYKKKLDSFRQTASHMKASSGETFKLPGAKRPRQDPEVTGTESGGRSENGVILEEVKGTKRLSIEVMDDHVTDTVGVVVLDSKGNVASTVSSGGIALKQPGRVGQASCFGCGCWAQNKVQRSHCQNGRTGLAVGVSTTGCGEHLVRTFLAKQCAEVLGGTDLGISDPQLALRDCMVEKFAESEFLNVVPEKLGGAICLQFDPESLRCEFMWTHTTASMGLAFQSTACEKATARMSRLEPPQQKSKPSGGGGDHETLGCTTILVEGRSFSLASPPDFMATGNGDAEESINNGGPSDNK